VRFFLLDLAPNLPSKLFTDAHLALDVVTRSGPAASDDSDAQAQVDMDVLLQDLLHCAYVCNQERMLSLESTHELTLESFPLFMIDAMLVYAYASKSHIRSLRLALARHSAFLDRMNQIFTDVNVDALSAGNSSFHTSSGSDSFMVALTKDDPRTRLRRTHALKKVIEAVEEDLLSLTETHERARGDAWMAALEMTHEDVLRRYWILRLFAHSLDMAQVKKRIEQEIEMIEYAASKGLTPGGDTEVDEEERLRLEEIRERERAEGQAYGIGPLRLDREDIRRMVFMNRNPWSMSIEEYGERLTGQMERFEQRKQQALDDIQREENSQVYNITEEAKEREAEEMEALKARHWDDWKDDNPRGAGNTMRR
jgi:hypothetical protein